jgi:hypothetical protein
MTRSQSNIYLAHPSTSLDIMFPETRPVQKRVEQRLQGFRAPSIKILRGAISKVDRAALTKPFSVPHVEPPSGLSLFDAWQSLGIPLDYLVKHQYSSSQWKSFLAATSGRNDGVGVTGKLSRLLKCGHILSSVTSYPSVLL